MIKAQAAYHKGDPIVAIFPWTETTTLEDICNHHFHEGEITEVITRPTGSRYYRISGTEALIPEDRLYRKNN
jgi:hypothetical protein